MRTERRIRVHSAQIGRRNHELKALDVSRRSAIPLVHVSAGHPFCAGRDPDLVARAVVAHGGAGRVRPMTIIVARSICIGAAHAPARVDRVVPVVIMIRGDAVPAAILRLERIVRPARAGIEIADNDAGALKAQSPDGRRVHIVHSPLHRGRGRRPIRGRREICNFRLLDPARRIIGIDPSDVAASGERFHDRAIGRGHDHVRGPEGLVAHAPNIQEAPEIGLRARRVLRQSVIDKPAAGILVFHAVSRAYVRLLGQEDDYGGELSIRRSRQHLGRDLRFNGSGRHSRARREGKSKSSDEQA